MKPELMLEQGKKVRAADLLLEGCAQEYLNALVQGRLAAWAKMAHSIIDLLACEERLPRDLRENFSANTGIQRPGTGPLE